MNSKIIVDQDFDKKEPYLQITLAQGSILADKTLRHFIERANDSGIEIKYPDALHDNNTPQIRIKSGDMNKVGRAGRISIIVTETSELFRKFLEFNAIEYSTYGECLEVFGVTDGFNLGFKWGEYKVNNAARD